MRRFLALALMVGMAGLPVSPVMAQSTGAACAGVEDDAERLACYDTVFRNAAPKAGDNMLMLQSEQLIPARPSGRERATMTTSCLDQVLSVQFHFANQFLSVTGDFAPITFQVDQASARTRTLNASPDNMALGFWTTGESNAFLTTLKGGNNLTVRVTPAYARSLTVRFALAGFEEAVAPIRAACEG
jgi:hypothetical protein